MKIKFSLFNFKGNRMISSSDFIQTLNQLGLNTGKDDMKYLFRKFNKKLNESFDFDEFSEIILPKKYSNEKIMDMEKRDIIMVMYMKDFGKMIKEMEGELRRKLMVLSMKPIL